MVVADPKLAVTLIILDRRCFIILKPRPSLGGVLQADDVKQEREFRPLAILLFAAWGEQPEMADGCNGEGFAKCQSIVNL